MRKLATLMTGAVFASSFGGAALSEGYTNGGEVYHGGGPIVISCDGGTAFSGLVTTRIENAVPAGAVPIGAGLGGGQDEPFELTVPIDTWLDIHLSDIRLQGDAVQLIVNSVLTGMTPLVVVNPNNFVGDVIDQPGYSFADFSVLVGPGTHTITTFNVLHDFLGLSVPQPPFPAPNPAGDPVPASYSPATGFASISCTLHPVIDIKFLSNPNALNCKKRGDLPLTIFGEDGFDVADIDVESLRLVRQDGATGDNAVEEVGSPVDSSILDRGNPNDAGVAVDGVDVFNPDGFDDLDVDFDAEDVADLIGCSGLSRRDTSPTLVLVGALNDGTPIESSPVDDLGIDQLLIKNK